MVKAICRYIDISSSENDLKKKKIFFCGTVLQIQKAEDFPKKEEKSRCSGNRNNRMCTFRKVGGKIAR